VNITHTFRPRASFPFFYYISPHYIMPKEYRAASHSYRSNPAPIVQRESAQNGTRVTSTWTAEDDQNLLEARASGMNWPPIAKKFFPRKSSNACRKRHERLIERRNAENWGGIKAEALAKQYMIFHAAMWKPLADSLGEKWQVIEAKVRTIVVSLSSSFYQNLYPTRIKLSV
jgi:hypothetical protein